MASVKEYIIPINDTALDCDEMFIGTIRKQEELIRCKDCHWHYGTLCRNNNTTPWKDEDFCSDAEREEYEID